MSATGYPIAAAACDGGVHVGDGAPGGALDAGGRQQDRRFFRRRPPAASGEHLFDDLTYLVAVDSIHERPAGPPALRATARKPVTRASASAADSGNAYDGIGDSAPGAPSARMNTPSTGLPGVPRAPSAMAPATSAGSVTRGGMKIVMTLSISSSRRIVASARR